MNSDQSLDDLAGKVLDVDKAFGVKFGRYRNLNTYCPFCENPDSSASKSCSISRDKEVFACKSCGKHGTAVEFYRQLTGTNGEEETELFTTERKPKPARLAKPKLTEDVVVRCHQLLLRSSIQLNYLKTERGLTMESIVEYEIGCDETRITIPIRNLDGVLIGMRRYLPHATSAPKMVTHEGGDGGAHLWPAQCWYAETADDERPEYVIFNEGEWDTILSRQHGFAAFTLTSGVQTWLDSVTDLIMETDVPVVLMYDVNDKPNHQGVADLGQRTARLRADSLLQRGIKVKVVALPIDTVGGDVTNWYVDEHRTADELRTIIGATDWFVPVAAQVEEIISSTAENGCRVTLCEATEARYFYVDLKLTCLVAGRGASPYLVPSRFKMEYAIGQEVNSSEHELDGSNGVILSLINCSAVRQKSVLGKLAGVPDDVSFTIEVLETMNVEEIYLIPSIDHTQDQGSYVMRTCYYVGHGIETNTVYDFEGYTLPDPRTQAATHILISARRASTNVDGCDLTSDQYAALREVFHGDTHDKLEDVSSHLAEHVTKIYGRGDLHTAVDLVFHSPLSFDFAGTRLRKGWLECLILGDTRTGKGFVAEGLLQHYGVGEIISGENLTFAGLVGGIQRVGERWILVWGKIPLNDKRLLILDECSALHISDIGKLSRIRSEGVAEVTKIISEKTVSRTRLIWLSNTRPSGTHMKVMADYNYGVEAVAELIGTAEDVARFDYVLTVAQNEVPTNIMNERHRTSTINTYTQELCRQLIVWVWSRKPEQIIIEPAATDYTYKAAKDLGKHFSSRLCLIQSEDVRFKLIRIAAAAAGRTFSSPDGVNLHVAKEHVEFAYNFLFHIYSKPSCGYAQLSSAERDQAVLRDPKGTLKILEQAGDLLLDLVNGLLEHKQITVSEICDYAGLDLFQARTTISELVRMRALIKEYNWYTKKPAFKAFLQDLKMRLVRDPHTTSWDDEDKDDDTDTDGSGI